MMSIVLTPSVEAKSVTTILSRRLARRRIRRSWGRTDGAPPTPTVNANHWARPVTESFAPSPCRLRPLTQGRSEVRRALEESPGRRVPLALAVRKPVSVVRTEVQLRERRVQGGTAVPFAVRLRPLLLLW